MAGDAPLIKAVDAEVASEFEAVLAKVPLGIKVKGANYPVLRVFASWPGEAKLGETLQWKEPKTKSQKKPRNRAQTQESGADNIKDPDLHPLAGLHLENFNKAGETLDRYWFQGNLGQKLVVHLKHAREKQDF
jgi:hypothetical protein